MFRTLLIGAALAMSPVAVLAAGGGSGHIENVRFSFDGPFGSYDQNQLQRGLQIYTEVCSACHGLRYVPIRTLSSPNGPGLPENQVRAYAAEFPVLDEGSNLHLWDAEEGEARALKETDNFPANLSQDAPDLSLIAKSRAGFHGPYGLGINQFFKGIGGPEYIVAFLTGYADPPACAPEDFAGSYNKVFASGGFPDECKDDAGNHTVEGSWVGMAQPLYGEDIDFADGHANDLHHEAEDIAAFLMWAAEPKMMERKQAGFTAVFFLTLLSVLLYATNKRLWARVKGKET